MENRMGRKGGVRFGAGRSIAAAAAQAATSAAAQGSHRLRRRSGAASPGNAPGLSSICRSSSPTSWAEFHRVSGSFARQVLTSQSNAGELAGCVDETGGGSVVNTAALMAAGDSPENARRPVAISKSTAPSEKMSVVASARLPSSCSGAM
jgi:hypothetical protein